MNLRRPSDPSFAANVVKAWPEISDKLRERERPAQGCPLHPVEPKYERSWRTMVRETAALHQKIASLYSYGVEIEHLVERFSLPYEAVVRIVRLAERV